MIYIYIPYYLPHTLHTLHSMPISPITTRLFQDKAYVQQEWEYLTATIPHLVPISVPVAIPVTDGTDDIHKQDGPDGTAGTDGADGTADYPYPSSDTPISNNNVIFTNYDANTANTATATGGSDTNTVSGVSGEWLALLYGVHAGTGI